jgi:tRNA A-37 threonylcarbamoyl transferase component Bud32
MSSTRGSNRLELTLLEELASGTFARVYLAEAKGSGGLDRIVAVKVLREKWADSDEVLARTRDEARLLARLRHKHIVRVEELSEFDGQPAIIMEYVEGMTLQQLVDHLAAASRTFPARAALQIGVATAGALDAAYRRVPYGMQEPLRVIHRDVKPSNVMLSIDGEVKVLDFGTARASSPLRSAQTGMVRFGSWKYMSPERKEGDRGDHAADVYSLGLVLVELLGTSLIKGLPVSPGEHDNQLRQLIEGLRDVGMPNDAWARALKDLLLQMSAFNPEVRPSAQQLSDVLRQYADQAQGQTIDALAADVVQGELRGKRDELAQGALTGTRLFVSLDGSAPPQARRADGAPSTDPGIDSPIPVAAQTAPVPAPSPAPTGEAFDEFEEPATVVAPFPSAGRYAIASEGAAQVRFGDSVAPQPETERTEPTPSDAGGFGGGQAMPAWDPAQAPQPAQPVVPQPRVTFDPAPAVAPTPTPAPQPAAGPAAPPPWEQAPQAFEPAPAHEHHDFAPAGTDPAETEYLPPPDAAPQQAQPSFAGAAPAYVQPAYTPVASGPVASGPVASGPVAPAPTTTPLPDPPVAPRRSKLPLILFVLFVLFVLCAGLPTVGWVLYSYLGIGAPGLSDHSDPPEITVPDAPSIPQDDAVVDEPLPPEPVVDAADPADPGAGDVGISINAADRAIRRIELADDAGALLLGSKGSLEGHFPPGTYQVTIKVAGRDPVHGEITLGDISVDLLCAPDDKMVKVLCKNSDGAISLVLK